MELQEMALFCAHCAMPAPSAVRSLPGQSPNVSDGLFFCCRGCREIYHLLCALREGTS